MPASQKPEWLKIRLGSGDRFRQVKQLVEQHQIHTICQSGRCPNLGQCWSSGTATFMILGDICTRNCRFCATQTGKPLPVNEQEPLHVAEAIRKLQLKYAVITSVDRDDLPDLGAAHWRRTIEMCRQLNPDTIIEVLIPDFQGKTECLEQISMAKPHIVGHNIETVRRLTPLMRNRAQYDVSLNVLRFFSAHGFLTKSGMMVGLGETYDEVIEAIDDLHRAGCLLLTIGQYLQPTTEQAPVQEYIHPETFARYKAYALSAGYVHVESAPLVRSSFMAEHSLQAIQHILFLPIQKNVNLQSLHTFQCASIAQNFVNIEFRHQLRYVFDHVLQFPVYILGGGSNVVLNDNIYGTVLKMNTKGIRILEDTPHNGLIEVEAGEEWDQVVSFCLEHGLNGLENLSGIPGTAGGAVVQNIGAFGRELAEFVEKVEAFDIENLRFEMLNKSNCSFSYRNSIFKKQAPLRYIVTRVYLRLPKNAEVCLEHYSLRKFFNQKNTITPRDVREAVLHLRQQRLPDIKEYPNAGSFFKNPVISLELAKRLLQQYPDMPAHPLNDREVKISAAWLIEHAGLKGKRIGQAAVSMKHALVITSDPGGISQNIQQLKALIQEAVFEKFQITLEPEVVEIGFSY